MIGGLVFPLTALVVLLDVLVVDPVGVFVEGPELTVFGVVEGSQTTVTTATVLEVLDLVAHLVTDGGLKGLGVTTVITEDHLGFAVLPTVVTSQGPTLAHGLRTLAGVVTDHGTLLSHSHEEVPMTLVNVVGLVDLMKSLLGLRGHVPSLGGSGETNDRGQSGQGEKEERREYFI